MESCSALDESFNNDLFFRNDSHPDTICDQDFFNCTKFQKNESGERAVPRPIEIKSATKKLKRWTAEEDKALLELFYKLGNDWKEIAKEMQGRAPSAVKNRFYWICNSKLPVQTLQKIKNTCLIKKLYKNPVNSNELYRKINDYLSEEGVVQSFLALDSPKPYEHLVHTLNISPEDVENHSRMQKLIQKAQSLYKSCEEAKASLECIKRTWNRNNVLY